MIELGFMLEHVENIDSKYDCILVVGEDFEKESYPSFCGGYLDVVQEAVKVKIIYFVPTQNFPKSGNLYKNPLLALLKILLVLKKTLF